MAENTEEKKYEPYDDRYFTLTRKQLDQMDRVSIFYGFPYEAPFFGYPLVDGDTHPYGRSLRKEWEAKHGPMPPVTIIEDEEE